MKRFKIVVLFLALFVLVGCNLNTNKKAITSDEFKEKMEKKGYTILDASSQFPQENIKKVSLAVEKGSTYQIEFYELDSSKSAEDFYDTNKTNFEKSKKSGYVDSYVELGNNEKYTLKTNGTYKVLSRIDNTIIYLNVNEKYKKDVDGILKELDY